MRTAALASIIASSALLASAAPLSAQQQVVLGHSPLDSLVSDDFHAALAQFEGTVEGFDLDLNAVRLVSFSEDDDPVWMTERQKIIEKAKGRKFMDVTESVSLGSFASTNLGKTYTYPKPNSTAVGPILKLLSTTEPRTNLEHFTSFFTRYYRSTTGKESSEWLLGKIESYISSASKDVKDRVSVKAFPHTWAQTSIIVKFVPESKEGKAAPVTIVGAHCDSTNMLPFLRSPGADDDGSGTVTTLEAFRALVESGYKPETPVEFHWYSAEEGGLLGSQAIAQRYAEEGVKVKAMIQMDMTAWVKEGTEESVGVITDFVDPALTEFNKAIIDKYLDIPWVETKCGYACSDHASFSKAGYQSSFTIESKFEDSDKNIHSANDKLDVSPEFSFEHMLEFSKLAVAFAVELGGSA